MKHTSITFDTAYIKDSLATVINFRIDKCNSLHLNQM